MTAVGNGAADLSPARSDTGTVPDHSILGSLVGLSHSVRLQVDLIVAPFLCLRLALAFDAGDTVARADQNAAQIRPFPLVVDSVELAVLYATILRH